MPSDPRFAPFRRVVTTHDDSGRSIVHSVDTLTPTMIPSGDAAFQFVWQTPTVPADLNAGTDSATSDGGLITRGSVLRIVDMVPGRPSPMHRTISIDYGVVISGQLELTLDGGETVELAAGDIVVQRGTNHLWRNPSDTEITRVAFILIEAEPVVVNGRAMEEILPVNPPERWAGRHVVVTGAAGFVGGRLVARLLADPAFADARITVNDLALGDYPERVRAVPGDFGNADVRAAMLDDRCDLLLHIGGLLGGAAEADPARARRVNIDATLALFEAAADETAPPRVVFASSIAVFGAPFPSHIDDDTRPHPTMVYGAQKAMIEIAVEQMSARGQIDGLALRLPGIVVKPGADARMKSAFLNRIFEVFGAGQDLILPVSPDGTTWLLSAPACIDALIHAATLPGDRIGARRAFTLPCQNVRFADLAAALRARWPDSATHITYAPEPAIAAQFGCQPPVTTGIADGLGFVHDGDVTTLVARAL